MMVVETSDVGGAADELVQTSSKLVPGHLSVSAATRAGGRVFGCARYCAEDCRGCRRKTDWPGADSSRFEASADGRVVVGAEKVSPGDAVWGRVRGAQAFAPMRER